MSRGPVKAYLALLFMSLLPLGGQNSQARAGPASGVPHAKFTIKTRREDDRITIRADKGKIVFVVKSPFGISQAIIERQEDHWPAAVVLQLHLKGLSKFRVSNGKVAVNAAASVAEGTTHVRVWKDGKEDALLDRNSPLWMNVCALGGDGKPAQRLPLEGGYFEVVLPRTLFADNPKTITVSWIDFYRS